METKEDRIIRVPEAVHITGRSKSSLFRDEKLGNFPARVRIGNYSVGYRLSAVREWMESLPEIKNNIKTTHQAA